MAQALNQTGSLRGRSSFELRGHLVPEMLELGRVSAGRICVVVPGYC